MVLTSMTSQKNHLNTIECSDSQCIRWLAKWSVGLHLTYRFQVVDGIQTAATDHSHPGGIKLWTGGCLTHGVVEVGLHSHLPSMVFSS